ncbi:hypothetical protein OG936_37610 [Streptomyces sp. NBC_00846]|uniref:hypothetical protein n=1 Tax=Streptomyces sp. NBC_00846 TaxID=2975849 RepID=UPI00386A75FE|nr:hypothetical protein OG936_37610 [Streptomyces sp. NBC_00846]
MIVEIGDAPPPGRGADITSEVWLDPSEAANGAVIPLRPTTHKTCPAVHGMLGAASHFGQVMSIACRVRSGEPLP